MLSSFVSSSVNFFERISLFVFVGLAIWDKIRQINCDVNFVARLW